MSLAKADCVLSKLDLIFDQFREKVHLDFSIISGDNSHYKKILHQEETHEGRLTIALTYFTGRKSTGLHIHPEYIIDEVIHGQMIENLYKKEGELYIFDRKRFRLTGDKRRIDCPMGHPHDVIAHVDPCVTLCLTMGQKEMVYL